MGQTTIQRVDETVMLRVLENHRGTVVEVILRFAWCMGFIPHEMHGVKWSDVDFEEGVIRLPDRSVPMDDGTKACLEARRTKQTGKVSEYVLVTELRQGRMSREYIFRCAKTALEKEGMSDISLMNLRQDFIVRQLERHSKAYVARISGITVSRLDAAFVKYAKISDQTVDQPKEKNVDTARLTEFIMKDPLAPERLALWMTWKQRLTEKELADLTWGQIDFETAEICMEDRCIPMDSTLRGWLCRLRDMRTPGDDPHVLLTPRTRKPFGAPRLSRAAKGALIKAGLDQIILFDLAHEEMDSALLRHIEQKGPVTRDETAALLQITTAAAQWRLRRMTNEGSLVRIGAKYYRAGSVVPPKEQYEVIRGYLEEVGGAYRQELADILHVDPQQCTWILRGFVEEGKLMRTKQRYTLPEEMTGLLKN